MISCLFVVDIQEGFVSDLTRYAYERILSLLKDNPFDHTVFTRFKNLPNSQYRRVLKWDALSTMEEQAFPKDLRPYVEVVFDKTIYSSVSQQSLEYINEKKIDCIFVAGIDTDCCVLKSAVDFFELDYLTFVLEHYSASNGGRSHHEAALLLLERLIGPENILTGPMDMRRLKLTLQKFKNRTKIHMD